MAVVLRNLRTLRSPTSHLTVEKFSTLVPLLLQPVVVPQQPAWRTWARGLQLSSPVCAGHNKWSKVKHIKGPKDLARSKVFQKLSMMIKCAVKEGGPNPELNINLAQVLEQCRNNSMPKATVEAAIKNAENSKPANEHIFAARGPGGCLFLIQVLTDNISMSQRCIKTVLTKKGGALSEGARNNFYKRGVVVVQGLNISTERALELAIEAGAEDVQETTDDEERPLLQYVCDTADLQKVQASLESLGLKVNSAGLDFVPRVQVPLDQQQLDAASTLVEALNDCDEVVKIWDNISTAEG